MNIKSELNRTRLISLVLGFNGLFYLFMMGYAAFDSIESRIAAIACLGALIGYYLVELRYYKTVGSKVTAVPIIVMLLTLLIGPVMYDMASIGISMRLVLCAVLGVLTTGYSFYQIKQLPGNLSELLK